MAFGTGHHETTRGCLVAFERLLVAGVRAAKVADIGCGTAVLALAAAKTWPEAARVWASDIDPVAVDIARVNVRANGASVVCLQAQGLEHPELVGAAPFDLIFANILMEPLIGLAPSIAAHLAPGGHAILSGILDIQADRMIAACEPHGLSCVRRQTVGEWCSLTLHKGDGVPSP